MQDEVLLADLARCAPRDAVSRDVRPGAWMAVDYETDEGKGVMLFGSPACDPPPLRLSLNADGWHQVRLGVYYGANAGFLSERDRVLLVKLSDDAAFSCVYPEVHFPKDGQYPEKEFAWTDICEAFWKSADLTGQDLIIARPPKGLWAGSESCLAYVRLTPMDSSAVAEWEAQQPRPDTKRLIANYDAGTWRQWNMSEYADFRAEFEPLRESDFDIVLWAASRGPIALYPSRVGEAIRPSGLHGFGWAPLQCIEKGVDPLAEVIRAAHDCGLKLFPQVRFVGTQVPPMHVRRDFGGRLMADHPEWLCTYPDDEPTRHLSFAFQGVRDFYVRLLREWVEDYHADGVNVIFSRSYPFVYYERPVRDAFRAEYGIDMESLPVDDERALRTRASFVTRFLREVRAMLDDVGSAQGRYIPNCYVVPLGNSPPNTTEAAASTGLGQVLFNALDVETWIREGLVDYLDVHAHVFQKHDGTELQPLVREFTDLARDTKTKVFVDIYPRRVPADHYRQIAMSYYEAGAEGISIWDANWRSFRVSEWAMAKRLGHRDELAGWQGKCDDYYRVVPMRRFDGYLTGREFSRPTDG